MQKKKTMLKVNARGEGKLEANPNKVKEKNKKKVNCCVDINKNKRLA
jgi:hypothetical protein